MMISFGLPWFVGSSCRKLSRNFRMRDAMKPEPNRCAACNAEYPAVDRRPFICPTCEMRMDLTVWAKVLLVVALLAAAAVALVWVLR